MSTPNTPRVPRMPTEEGDLWRLSVDRYERMVASGVITQDDRVELLEGVLVNKMSKSPEHVLGTILVSDALRALVPAGWSLRSEQPIRMDDSEPEPDAAVTRGQARNYAARHPISAEISIIIEVADSSLRRDREDKRRIYARNGIAVYWIVNVADRLIDVFTDPSGPVLTPDYATTTTYRPGDVVPVVIAGAQVGGVPVADLLPKSVSMNPAIRIRGLVKTYPGRPPVEAVRGLDLEVHAGECFGLLGPNGAGKTTTLEIVEGLLDPTAGDVEVLGMKWGRDDEAIRRKIGISLQETRLSDKLTVHETVTLFRSFYPAGLTPDEAIARVSLEEKAKSYVEKLSGGQRQRLAVATALVGEPDLLFLDEPTTGLDPQSRRQLWEVIRSLKGRGCTVVITTHYMDEAERLCDRVAVIDHGQVLAIGAPAELIARVGGEHVIDFNYDPATPTRLPASDLNALPTVKSAREEGDRVTLTAGEPHRALPALLELARAAGVKFAGLTTRTATLEDVFVTLTGRHLRDGE